MTPALDQVQQILQQTLRQFEELSHSPAPATVVLTQILQALCRVTASPAALVWVPAPDPAGGANAGGTTFIPVAGVGNPAAVAVIPAGTPVEAVLTKLRHAAATLKPAVTVAGAREFAGSPLADFTQVFAPIDTIGKPLGVVHLIAPGALPPATLPQFTALVQRAAGAAGKCLARKQAQLLKDDAIHAAAVLRAIEHLLPIDEPDAFAHELANTARRTLGASRAAVVIAEGRPGDVAVSQLFPDPAAEPGDDLKPAEPAADVKRALAELATTLGPRTESLLYPATGREEEKTAEAVAAAVSTVLHLAGSKSLAAIPLRGRGGEAWGWLLAEFATVDGAREKRAVGESLAKSAAVLLGRAIRGRPGPLTRAAATIETFARRKRRR